MVFRWLTFLSLNKYSSVQFFILNSTVYIHLLQVHINPRLKMYKQCKRKFNNINMLMLYFVSCTDKFEIARLKSYIHS